MSWELLVCSQPGAGRMLILLLFHPPTTFASGPAGRLGCSSLCRYGCGLGLPLWLGGLCLWRAVCSKWHCLCRDVYYTLYIFVYKRKKGKK